MSGKVNIERKIDVDDGDGLAGQPPPDTGPPSLPPPGGGRGSGRGGANALDAPTRMLWRASRRYHFHHPWQLALAVLGIALGVAVVVGVDLSTASARAAFRLTTDIVAGGATHHVVGGPTGVPDSVYRMLRVDAGIRAIAPVVEAHVRTGEGADARTYRLLGLDPFAEAPFRPYLATRSGAIDSRGALDLSTVMTRPGAVLLSDRSAREHGLAPGDTFTLRVAGRPREAVLAGTVDSAAVGDVARRALAGVMLADIATAQELLGTPGVLDRIDIRAGGIPMKPLPPPGRGWEGGPVSGGARPSEGGEHGVLERVRAALPPGLRVVSASERAEATAGMMRAFETNLAALALLALVFGVFLVYNSMTFSVVQRRALIGLLRAQGVTRAQLFTVITAEAVVIGAIATAIGIGLGMALSGGLVRLVSRTINDLYFTVTVTRVVVTPLSLFKAVALGIGATVLASLPPARESTSAAPRAALARSMLEARARATARPAAAAGAAIVAGGLSLLLLPSRALTLGFIAVFTTILGAALLTPAATMLLMRAIRPAAGMAFGALGRMATRGVVAGLSRTAPAIAALAVAVAAGIAIGTMIGSFRTTVERWLGTTLQADFYVAVPEASAESTPAPLDPGLADRIRAIQGVAGVTTYRTTMLAPDLDIAGNARLVAVDLFPRHRAAFHFVDADARDVWAAFDAGDAVLVSESFAYRHGADAGDTLRLPVGPSRAFRVAGVFRDYATEHGVIFLDRREYALRSGDDDVSSIAVFAAPGANADSIARALRDIDTGGQEIAVRTDRALREATLRVFDRTFAITSVLRTLALVVALAGVLSALLALELERSREIGILRATGLTARGAWAMIAAQTGLTGLAAGVLALPLGALLAWIMTRVINQRAFGWTIDLALDPATFGLAVVLAVAAALIAGVYPAYRMSRTPPAVALRELSS